MAKKENKVTGNKSTETKNTNISKEEKVMKKNEVVVAEKKEVVAPVEDKKAVENEKKVDAFVSIEEIAKLYDEAGIKCTNPTAKGNYRIMGSKSSLNLKPKKGYFIYTADSDFEALQKSKIKAADLVIEKGTNSQDKTRPNTVICTTVATLKAVLAVYAQNPLNAKA